MAKTIMKLILLFPFMATPLFQYQLYGQGGNCPRIKVGVKITEVYQEVFDRLDDLYMVEKHRAVWISELGEKLMENLKNNSPEIDFIYLPGSVGADYDYLFIAYIMLMGGGEDIKVVSEDTVIIGNNIFITSPIYDSEYTDFYVVSSLIVNSNCFPNRRYILEIHHAQDGDIFLALAKNVALYYRLINILEARENLHPVPPREPTVITRLEKEFVSLLSIEARKIKIYENIKSCNGRVPYFSGNSHSQPVKFPIKTERAEVKPSENCKVEQYDTETQYVHVNPDGDAVGEYEVKRGFEPLLEKITLSTCPLGNKPNIEREVEFIIRGLELSVMPDRNNIYSGEKTSIQISMEETDPDGTVYTSACEGQEVDVQVNGLVDGIVSPGPGKIKLNEVGAAFIEYHAGQKDKKIEIVATFTPPGYPETLVTGTFINVKPLEYETTLTLKSTWMETEHSSVRKEESRCTYNDRSSSRETREAVIYIPLKLENVQDIPVMNQRWEFYSPLDITLTTCRATFREDRYHFEDCIIISEGSTGSETTTAENISNVTGIIDGKETFLESKTPIIALIKDRETDKVVKLTTYVGFRVSLHMEHKGTTTGKWWHPQKGTKPVNNTYNKPVDVRLSVQPVGDEIPDPTVKTFSESLKSYLNEKQVSLPIEIPDDKKERPEIKPDLLVTIGDGQTNFGGSGKKIIERTSASSSGRREITFEWHVTRKQKQ